MEIPIELGAFEVYFMDILIYSKLVTHNFPDLYKTANKCIDAYHSYHKGHEMTQYIFKKQSEFSNSI